MSEFSCDRAALLATQDPKIIMSVLMKLAGGSPSLAPQLNLEAFIEQARAYEIISEDSLGETLKALHTEQLTHPVPVIRAREIERWASTAQYHNLLFGDRAATTVRSRNMGGKANSSARWRNW